MNNIFDYATKELSQDAFLQWLINNFNEEDLSLRKAAQDFLDFLAGETLNLDLTKAKVETSSQVKHIDIVIKIYRDKTDTKHDLIAIEDKTFSSEHKQLQNYNNAIKNMENGGKVYKVFFKTSFIDKDELDRVVNINGWKAFDIDAIYKYFKKYVEHDNLIMQSYARHIVDVYDKLRSVSEDAICDWDYYNAITFFKNEIETFYKKMNQGVEKVCEFDIYQGRYSSSRFYYYFTNPQLNKKYYPLIEFVFRDNSDVIKLYGHVSFRENDFWTWKWQNPKLSSDKKDERETIVKDARSSFVKIGFKKRGNLSNPSTQTIATYSIRKKQTKEQLAKDIEGMLAKFVEVFDEYNK